MAREIISVSTTEHLAEEVKAAARREGVSVSSVINQALDQFFQTKIARSSWETEAEAAWYSPQKFYTNTEDKHGHSSLLRVWVPKNLAGQIGRIVESGVIPELRSRADFYRDAMLHRAHNIATWLDDGVLDKEVRLSMLLSEEEAIQQAKKDAENLTAATQANLEDAWERRDYDWMREHIVDRRDKAGAIQEAYREDFTDMLDVFITRLFEINENGSLSVSRKRRKKIAGNPISLRAVQ